MAPPLQEIVSSPQAPAVLQDEVDMNTFNQIAEIDDSGNSSFCISLYFDFFGQAEDTFKSMRSALDIQDYDRLSSLAHYIKGSSATVGLFKIHDGCERIERFSKQRDGSTVVSPQDAQQSTSQIRDVLVALQEHNKRAEHALRRHFGMKTEA
ncbi:hpt domain-containing protein [Purpureocillium lilacinum]|uniref:Hpt domain-containing protein n=1 Tax=Purpureocillium lilacinum TaxID=33203 RepID=A0A179HB66_PURLI|nr:hpt domain-containing protein [Purpureocillium lilacinum]OAQ87427.1 hpt domain-containing protein [Purpureocillium lilacinum]OAQ95385.1 hpt domain-containing protein [Purpureocillium lilacinum]